METIFEYLLKASIGIILFYTLYWFLLRKETFYTANRIFLFTTLIISVILPLITCHYTVLIEQGQNQNTMDAISNSSRLISSAEFANNGNNFFLGWMEAILLIYLTGAFLFLIRLLIQSTILVHLIIKHNINSLNGLRILKNEKYGLPFSFFNIVFINPKFHTQDDLPYILAHETVHIRENHWVDLIVIELLTVIFWFNPFIWFFERSIKQNHEYLADSAVITNGSGVARYQALLVNQLMGMQIIGITNNLNFALNKNRLKMMTKQKTPKTKAIKLAWALPAIALLLFAFAEPEYRVKEDLKNSISSIQKGEKEFIIHGKVVEEESGSPLPGASILIKGTSIGTVSDMDGTFTLTDPNPKIDKETGSLSSNLTVSFVGFMTLNNVISASGNELKNNRYTFKMKEAAHKLDLQKMLKEVPPPPPPPPPAKEISGETTSSPSKNQKNEFYIIESMPVYPGGQTALAEYISKSAKKYAKMKEIAGTALIGFRVNSKGVVDNINIIEKDNDKAGKAAYAIISGLKDWQPGKQRGKPVSVNYIVPIEF